MHGGEASYLTNCTIRLLNRDSLSQPDTCLCETGWQGAKCDECVPYWNCPSQTKDACVEPNQCICTNDDNKFCNKEYINGMKDLLYLPCQDKSHLVTPCKVTYS